MPKTFIASILLVLTLILASTASIAGSATVVLAGGCFWCMESDFEKLEGVTDVVSGFSGGSLPNPTYNGNHTGHYEVVEVTYDTDKLSFRDVLDYYWVNIDPFDPRGQFCDKGHSYKSAIFVANDEERQIAEATKAEVVAMFPDKKVVTSIMDRMTFWPIKGDEAYHQDYAKNNPVRYNYYRWACGRDRRLEAIWGDRATH